MVSTNPLKAQFIIITSFSYKIFGLFRWFCLYGIHSVLHVTLMHTRSFRYFIVISSNRNFYVLSILIFKLLIAFTIGNLYLNTVAHLINKQKHCIKDNVKLLQRIEKFTIFFQLQLQLSIQNLTFSSFNATLAL